MAIYEHSIFYESEKELPRIDQSVISIEPEFNFDEPVEGLIIYLTSLEPLYIEHIKANKNRPDIRVVNEIFFACTKLFESDLDLCIIYSEIIDFFQFDNNRFYKLLNIDFKKKLKIALSKRIDVNILEKERENEIKENGGLIPTFSQILAILS